MKIWSVLAIFVLVEAVCGKNAWDTEAARMDLEAREAKRLKTSIIAYNKNEIDVDAEANRIVSKCEELGFRYVHYPNLLSNVISCFQHLKKMGLSHLHEI